MTYDFPMYDNISVLVRVFKFGVTFTSITFYIEEKIKLIHVYKYVGQRIVGHG